MQWLIRNRYRRSLTSFLRVLRNVREAMSEDGCNLCEDIKDVRDFGAVCDGTTDNTVAVQTAVDNLPISGGLVFIPGGCLFSGVINLGPDDYILEL